MEGLIIVFILWVVFSNITKGAKKAKQAQAAKQTEVNSQPTVVAKPSRPSAQSPSVWGQITEMMAESEKQPAQTSLALDEGGEGEGYADASGCVGGSISHGVHEGQSKSGSLDYTPSVQYAPVERAPDAEVLFEFGQSVRRLNASDMRRAVVMAEVLNRPKSLRRRCVRT